MSQPVSMPALTRRLLWGLAAIMALGGALAWLAGSETALRIAASQAEAWSGGKLRLQGVQGSLYGPLQIERLSLTTEEKRFDILQARLDWKPRELLHRHLHISQLSLAELKITELKPSPEPPERPESLALPVSLSLPRASLDRLVMAAGKSERVFTGMVLSLEKPARQYAFKLLELDSPWGKFQGRAELAEAPPFAINGQASLAHPSGRAQLIAAGTLDRLRLNATAALAGGKAEAEAVVNPFSSRPVIQALVTATGTDPSAWNPDLPGAGLDLDVTLASEGQDAFAGELALGNSRPGAWNRQLVPLKHLAARFSGNLEGVKLSDIQLDLGRAGRFTGNGQGDRNGLVLSLQTRDFDPQGIHGDLQPMRLAGDIRLQADSRQQHVLADLGYQRYQLKLDASHRDRVIQFNEVRLSSGGGTLSLFGTLGLDAARHFELAGGLSGFDPAVFGNFPKSRLNASFTTAGNLLPRPQGFLRFAIADSHFRRQPLSGQGGFTLSEKRLWDSDVVLKLATNRLEIKGAFGAPGDHLDVALRADRPEIITPALKGRIEANGQLSGSLAAPSGNAVIQASGLGWRGDYRLDHLRARASLAEGLDGLMTLDARLQGLKSADFVLTQASALAQGRRSQHALSLTAKNPVFDLSAELAGSWQEKNRASYWTGQLMKLNNTGAYPLRLQAPARLEVAANRFSLAEASLDFLGGGFNVRQASYQDGQLDSHGQFRNLPIASLNRLNAGDPMVEGDLSLAGEWDLAAKEKLNGRLVVWREGGDLILAGDTPATMGLKHLRLEAESVENRLQARLEASGDKLGRLGVEAVTQVSRRGKRWGIAGDAPLQGKADLAIQSLAWATPFLDKTGRTRLEGALQAQVKGSGTLSSPNFTGTLSGDRFRIAIPDQGLDFREGRFQAELKQDTLQIRELVLRSGDGQLGGQGFLVLRPKQPEMKLVLQADRFSVFSRPDRLLILSGKGRVDLVENRLQLSAQLKADRGHIELAREDAPQVSSDVVVLGRPARPASRAMPYAVRMELGLELGDRFYLRGRGLDAQLGGTVRLAGKGSDALNANGSIHVVKGAYSAYGQRLVIDRGILNFQGPIDNPGLNILAMRKNQQVEAGVAITGSAQSPRVTLVSNPVVPDSEKLAWLVLGHGLAETGAQEFDSLQIAAGALLGASESVTLQQRIAHAAGLEEVSLKGAGTLESTVLTLGKRLSSRAYLSYEQGLTGTDTLVKINYTLTQRLSLRAQAGTTPAVDLFYTFSFD